ncbi:MAG TPA: hypothetical protein VF183_05625 [Acidimicrobiales bacterium]
MINAIQILRDIAKTTSIPLDRNVKRIVKQHQLGQTVFLLAEMRDGRWLLVDRCLEPDSFDVTFHDNETDAMARAPAPLRRAWE